MCGLISLHIQPNFGWRGHLVSVGYHNREKGILISESEFCFLNFNVIFTIMLVSDVQYNNLIFVNFKILDVYRDICFI